MLQLSSAYKHTTAFSILNIKKFLWSYLFPQLSQYSSALLNRNTRKTCWCSPSLFPFLLLFNHRQLGSSVMATNCLPIQWSTLNLHFLFFFSSQQYLIQVTVPPSWSTFFTWLPWYHTSGFLSFFLWSLFLCLCWILCISPPFSNAPAYSHLSISCLYPLFLNDHLHFCSSVYHLYNSPIYIPSPDFWMSLWNPQFDIQYLPDTQ